MNKVFGIIDALETNILWISILIITLVSCANVFARYMLNNSWPFVEELCALLIVISTCIGLSYAVRQKSHICMSALLDSNRLSCRQKRNIEVIIALIGMILALLMIVAGLRYVNQNYISGRTSPSLAIPWYTINLFFPIGFGLAFLQWGRHLFTLVLGAKENNIKKNTK